MNGPRVVFIKNYDVMYVDELIHLLLLLSDFRPIDITDTGADEERRCLVTMVKLYFQNNCKNSNSSNIKQETFISMTILYIF